MHLGLRTDPLCPMFCTKLKEPCSFTIVPDGPYTKFPDILKVQKKGPKCVCLSKTKAWHSHKVYIEVSSSVPHFLEVGLLLSPITYKCLLMVLYPVRRPITTLNCVLLNDNNQAFIDWSGPEINSQDCLCVFQWPHHNTRCWFSIQHFMFLLIFYVSFSAFWHCRAKDDVGLATCSAFRATS